jgi:hypothetical protein
MKPEHEQVPARVAPIELRDPQRRCQISKAKHAFLRATQAVIENLREFWALSLRQIHYFLLNDPPLTHSSKPKSRYRNDKASYRQLVDLVTRARHEGAIDHDVIDDETRPATVWDVHEDLQSYYDEVFETLFDDYSRDLLQSQSAHFELVVEKNTLLNVLRPVASEFTMPISFGRGQCSTPPLWKIAKRYRSSGKKNSSSLL